MANLLSILVGPIVDLVKSYSENKAKAKERAQELDGALQQKKLEIVSKTEDYAQAFRVAQVQNAGWRPGFWTIVLAAPVVMCFVPSLAPYVTQGFEALKGTPEWFQYFLGISVTSAFGYQVADQAYEWWKAP